MGFVHGQTEVDQVLVFIGNRQPLGEVCAKLLDAGDHTGLSVGALIEHRFDFRVIYGPNRKNSWLCAHASTSAWEFDCRHCSYALRTASSILLKSALFTSTWGRYE